MHTPKLFVYVLLASILLSGCSGKSRKAANASSKSKDILHTLIPNDYAEATKLNGIDHDKAISALLDAQEVAIGMRAISIAYLLAALRQDYDDNRNKVTTAISACHTEEDRDNCDVIAGYGIDLFNRGDKTLLKPLLDLGIGSDAALSEELGEFYSNVLSKDPETFLKGLSEFPNAQQMQLAQLAGAADHSAMPDSVMSDIRNNLQKLATQKNNSLAPIAKTCLDGVNRGDKQVKASESTDK